MKKIILFSLLIALIIAMGFVIATDSGFVVTTNVPAAYSTSTLAAVNFSITANWSTSTILNNLSTVNCSLYIKTAAANNYSLNISNVVLNRTGTGNTGWINKTLTFADKTRVWSYWNCMDNATATELTNTSVRIIDVDLSYDTLTLGSSQMINFSLSTGRVTMSSLQLSQLTAPPIATTGTIYFNSTDYHFYGYNSTAWRQLD